MTDLEKEQLHELRKLTHKNFVNGILYAALEVNKLANRLIGNTKVDGTRDPVVYEQGIGCERAGKMLIELVKLKDQQFEK